MLSTLLKFLDPIIRALTIRVRNEILNIKAAVEVGDLVNSDLVAKVAGLPKKVLRSPVVLYIKASRVLRLDMRQASSRATPGASCVNGKLRWSLKPEERSI